MKGYTPGPWHVMEDGFKKSGRGYPTVYATDDELRYIAKCADFCNMNPTDNLANAYLISAAPDLLEACISMRDHLNDVLLDCDSPGSRQTLECQIDMLNNAIEKARKK